jgi:hypothetical protein
LAKAALVASAKALLRRIAAESTIFLVVNICRFLSDQSVVFAARLTALEQIVRSVGYSRRALL